jgi:diguanylate cyclase (GGDEF)-like protein
MPQSSRHIPLRLILIAPFVIQIVAAIGITGWISYRSGEKAIANTASELLLQAKYRIRERLDRLLSQSEIVLDTSTYAYKEGYISIERSKDLAQYFLAHMQRNNPPPQAIYMGDPQGRYLLVNSKNQLEAIDTPGIKRITRYTLDGNGDRQNPVLGKPYDPRQRPWYQAALPQNEIVWTKIYQFVSGGYGITAAKAVRDTNQQVSAIIAIDLGLDELNAFLNTIRLSPSSQLYIVEETGFLVANSTSQSLDKLSQNKTKGQRIPAIISPVPIIRESSAHLLKQFQRFDLIDEPVRLEFISQQRKTFLSVLPYEFGNDVKWLVVTVVPEEDFTDQIEDNRRNTVLLCGISLFLAIAVGTITSRTLTKTILRLAKAADEIGNGNWNQQEVTNSGFQEMEILVNSFERMRERLQDVFQQLENYAYVDSLTGLPNQAAFLIQLQYALAVAKEFPSPCYAVLLIDLNSFELIENGLGQATSELLLKSVSNRLQECLKTTDCSVIIICRLERDEFAILLTNITKSKEAINREVSSIETNIPIKAAQTILQAFQKPFNLDNQNVVISASIGVAMDEGNKKHPEEILRDARMAKLSAKNKGKANYVVFDAFMRVLMTEQLQLEASLQSAIEQEEFELWYQPIIGLNPNRIAGLEALIRWQHPSVGMISPVKFIPLAEATGAIASLGIWALQTACRQMKLWQDEYLTLKSAYISVNVSAKQLLVPDFALLVEQILQETGLKGCYLQLEITESAIVSQPEIINEKLEYLQNLGVKICIDDFGTGYSHLSYLLELPIDVLKIDRSFIKNIGKNDKTAAIAKAILGLTESLEIDAIAEGVETSGQFNLLQSFGCQRFQGYLFSAPIHARSIPDFQPVF